MKGSGTRSRSSRWQNETNARKKFTIYFSLTEQQTGTPSSQDQTRNCSSLKDFIPEKTTKSIKKTNCPSNTVSDSVPGGQWCWGARASPSARLTLQIGQVVLSCQVENSDQYKYFQPLICQLLSPTIVQDAESLGFLLQKVTDNVWLLKQLPIDSSAPDQTLLKCVLEPDTEHNNNNNIICRRYKIWSEVFGGNKWKNK